MEKNYSGVLCSFSSLTGEQLGSLRKELKDKLGCRVSLLRKSGLASGYVLLYKELHGAYLIYSLNSVLCESDLIDLVGAYGGYPICIVQDGVLNNLNSYMLFKSRMGGSEPSLFLSKRLLQLSVTILLMYKRNLSIYLLRKV